MSQSITRSEITVFKSRLLCIGPSTSGSLSKEQLRVFVTLYVATTERNLDQPGRRGLSTLLLTFLTLLQYLLTTA